MAEPPSDLLKQRFFQSMSSAACSVNVVTTDGRAGRAGVTVSAMASVSADTPKPVLLVCVHHKSPAAAAILENRVFCVNLLRDDQSYISDTFAGRIGTGDGDKFSCVDWTRQVTGAPRVVDPLVAFDCSLLNSERVGTHHVLFGAVEDIFIADAGSPLIYANRAYGTPSRIDAPRAGPPGATGETLRLGCFHTFGPYVVPELVSRLLADRPNMALRLQEGDHRQVVGGLAAGETELALIYDLDLGAEIAREPLATVRPYVLLAAGHPLTERPAVRLCDLAEEPMVLLDAPPSRDYFLSLFEDAGLEPFVRFRSSSFEMVRGLVGRGLGYSLLATKPASGMTYDGRALVAWPLADEVRSSVVVLASRQGARLSPIADAFAGQCRDFFRRAAG